MKAYLNEYQNGLEFCQKVLVLSSFLCHLHFEHGGYEKSSNNFLYDMGNFLSRHFFVWTVGGHGSF